VISITAYDVEIGKYASAAELAIFPYNNKININQKIAESSAILSYFQH